MLGQGGLCPSRPYPSNRGEEVTEADDEYPEDGCIHEEYELDILIGLATCTRCDHRWYMTDEELKRDERLRQIPYTPGED